MDQTNQNSQIDNEIDRKRRLRNGIFATALVILIIATILSAVLLAIRLIDYIKVDDREVLLKSNLDTELDIFSIKYENASGEITVSGMDDQKVVAPGTSVEYTIRLRNKDEMALDYELLPEVSYTSEHTIPILIRMLDTDGNYIVGDAKTWVTVEEFKAIAERRTLLSNETIEYYFQWRWAFESGDDAYDTFLGNIANTENVGISVKFNLFAVANTSIGANGGHNAPLMRIIRMLIVVILLVIATVLFIIYIIKKLKDKGVEPSIIEVIKTIEVPVVKTVVAPAPAPMPEIKQEGFNGKMAYVNLDVISKHFEAGEVVSLSALKKKELLPAKTKQMKILARGGFKLDKALIVETQGISTEARRIIVEAGGMVFITKG